MGASDWRYVEPIVGDVQRTFIALRQRLFDKSRFRQYVGDGLLSTFDVMTDGDEEFEETGAHTILDMLRVVPSLEEDSYRSIRMLSDQEIVEYLGGSAPASSDFEKAIFRDPLFGVGPRWTGRAVVLHDEQGVADRVAFWGWSGD